MSKDDLRLRSPPQENYEGNFDAQGVSFKCSPRAEFVEYQTVDEQILFQCRMRCERCLLYWVEHNALSWPKLSRTTAPQ